MRLANSRMTNEQNRLYGKSALAGRQKQPKNGFQGTLHDKAVQRP